MPYICKITSILALLYVSINAQTSSLLTISEAESIAVRNAFGIQRAQQTTVSGKWQFWNALSSYLPSVEASSQYLRLDENYFSTSGSFFPGVSPAGNQNQPSGLLKTLQQPEIPIDTAGIPQNLFIHEITISQPIVNSSVITGIQIASAAREAQKYRNEATRQEVIFDVREAYYNTIAARGRLDAAQLALQFSQESLQNAKIREESGIVPITDVLRWEARVAQNRFTIAQAEAALELGKLNLLSVMGYDVDTNYEIIELQPFEIFANQCTTTSYSKLDTVVNIEKNPAWKAVRKSNDIARLQVTLALTRYFPVLSGFYTYQWEAYDEFWPDDGGIWYLGITLTLPFFRAFTTTFEYLDQRAQTRISEIDQQEARNDFFVQARSALLAYNSSLTQVEASHRHLELMERTLSIMSIRYRSGVANQTDLLQVAVETEQARVDFVVAVTDCLVARSRYKLSIGTLEIK